MAALQSAQAIAAKWQQRTAASGQAFADGVNAVTDSPTAKAAQSSQKFLAGIQAAVASGKWQNGLNAVSLSDWKTAMLQKGAGRISSGTQAAVPKMTAFMQQFLPVLQANVAMVKAMPNMTQEDRIQRAVAMMRANAKFTFQK